MFRNLHSHQKNPSGIRQRGEEGDAAAACQLACSDTVLGEGGISDWLRTHNLALTSHHKEPAHLDPFKRRKRPEFYRLPPHLV